MSSLYLTSALVAATFISSTIADSYLLNYGFKVQVDNGVPPACPPNTSFPINYNNQQCMQLNQAPYAIDVQTCLDACCAVESCQVYQFCPAGSTTCNPPGSCWIGPIISCQPGEGWISGGRNSTPPAPPVPGKCSDPGCDPNTNDANWRVVTLPHDFVVEGNFSQNADKSHGYLPYAKAWYRKHFTLPSSASTSTAWISIGAAQTNSQVYLNGYLLGTHAYGYTPMEYYINSTIANYGGDNVLAILVDATNPDSWWYDGGGLYRHVYLHIIDTPGPYLAPYGIYAPSNVTGTISWSAEGIPTADSILLPTVEVWSNATSATPIGFCIALNVIDPTGKNVGNANGCGSAPGNGASTMWAPSAPIALPGALLWHTTSPNLYSLQVSLTIAGKLTHAENVTFGIRQTRWDGATGFYLNGINTKILGMANHQDMAAVGVAVPDHLQNWRILKLKEFGANGWRTVRKIIIFILIIKYFFFSTFYLYQFYIPLSLSLSVGT
jgi:Glycosyl hydrolases family 2, sugar binding domain/Glycosyl hydrolases family 2